MHSDIAPRTPAPLPPRLRRVLAARLGLPPSARWQVLDGGRSARSYLLRHRAQALVLKLGRAEVGARLFPIRPHVEHDVMARLAPAGLSLPPLAFFAYGRDACLVYRHVQGRGGNPPDASLARLLRRLHDLPLGTTADLPRQSAPSQVLIDRACRHLATSPETERLRALIRDAAGLPAPNKPSLLHGDPVPGNVIRTAHGPVLIDWQCASVGDPCRDLALALSPAMQMIHGLAPVDKTTRARFLDAYGAPDVPARLARRAPAFHGEMIGHCLWRLDQGDSAYCPALQAELAALRALSEDE